VSVELHVPAALPPIKVSVYPLDRALVGPHSPFGQYGEVKIIDPIGARTPAPRSFSPAALPRLLYQISDSSAAFRSVDFSICDTVVVRVLSVLRIDCTRSLFVSIASLAVW
jgi:hypothetical protein